MRGFDCFGEVPASVSWPRVGEWSGTCAASLLKHTMRLQVLSGVKGAGSSCLTTRGLRVRRGTVQKHVRAGTLPQSRSLRRIAGANSLHMSLAITL